MKRLAMMFLLALAAACSGGGASDPVQPPEPPPPPPPPPPLVTVFEGAITGATNAEVEAACKTTPLPNATDWQYVIRQLDRVVMSRAFSEPWPGRYDGDVHAKETATLGRYRFSCQQRDRQGTAGSQFVVELGQEQPGVVTVDVKVCEGDGGGGSRATAVNSGQLACPYNFGNLFTPVADHLMAGPFPTVEEIQGPTCTIHRPATLGESGRRHPIVLWGNGITLGPNFYRGLLRHLASHGFVVAATDTTRNGTGGNGQAVLACLDYLEAQNSTAGSVYENKLNTYRIGAAGHSAGGSAILMAGRDARIRTTVPIQAVQATIHGYDPAAPGFQNGPMFVMSGEKDTVVSPVSAQTIFANANTPTIWAMRLNSGHNDPLFDAPNYRRPLTSWLRLHLMLDASTIGWFYGQNCVLCGSPVWVVQRKNGLQ